MRTNFNVDVTSNFLGDKYHAEGSADISNVYPNISADEVSGRLGDLVSAGLLLRGPSIATEPDVQKDFFGNEHSFFDIDDIDFSNVKVTAKNGRQEILVSKQKEK